MAISGNAVWEVRPTNGVDTNSGGFVTGASGTDYSQQAAAQYALTGLTTAAANAIILSASAAADMVGNIIRITGGTNFTAGLYQITAVSVGVSITVDRNVTTAAGAAGTANIGGAVQTIGQMSTILATSNQNAPGMIVWVKAEATITTGAQISFNPGGGTGANPYQLNGYTTTRGDNGQVTIQATAGSGFGMLSLSPSGALFVRNFIFDGNSRTGITGIFINNAFSELENCKAMNCTTSGFSFVSNDNKAFRCQATANAIGFTCDFGNGANIFIECVAYANTGPGFSAAVGLFLRCISANNTGGSSDGFGSALSSNSRYCILINCLAYANGRDGFRFNSSITCTTIVQNCISYGNSGKDFQCVTNLPHVGSLTADYNAYVTSTNWTAGAHDVTLSGDPTTAGGSNNFALNNTAGAGAACRAAGFPGVLTIGGTGYQDIGALQHQDAGGSTTTYVINRNVTRLIVDEGEL